VAAERHRLEAMDILLIRRSAEQVRWLQELQSLRSDTEALEARMAERLKAREREPDGEEATAVAAKPKKNGPAFIPNEVHSLTSDLDVL